MRSGPPDRPGDRNPLRDGLWLEDGSFIGPQAFLELLDLMRKIEAERAPLQWRRRPAGRPSPSREPTTSPIISFRVPREMRDRARLLARWEDMTLSQYAREALESYMWAPSLGPLRYRGY